MDGWKEWEGKQVFIILKNNRNYSGIVKRIEIIPPLVWITINDKKGDDVLFSAEEMSLMQEENDKH